MIKYFGFILFVITIQNQISAQTNAYRIPNIVEYAVPNDTMERLQNLHDVIRPIGWSKDGKFAYILEPADEACGCYFFEIHIIDIKTNKTIWTWRYSDENKGEKSGTTTINDVWAEQKKTFTKKLNEAKIFQLKTDLKLEPVWNENGQAITKYELSNTLYEGEDWGRMLFAASIKKLNGTPNAPTIYQKQYATWDKERKIYVSYVRDSELRGYFSSPYEKRIVMLHCLRQRGWEGTPNVLRPELIGLPK